MYPEPDSRADEFDEAVERHRAGDNRPNEDEDLQSLVNLAARLERELPDETPDPSFRENLKYQLLQSYEQLQQAAESGREPVDLEDERWFRRLVASPWRVSAAAAACLVFIVIAVVGVGNPFGADTGDSGEDVTSFRPVDADDSSSPDDWRSTQFPLDVDDDSLPASEQWFTASFPPIDVEHVVLPPLLIGFLPFSERQKPRVEIEGISDLTDRMDMPGSGTVYYLNSPPDGATMLTTLRSALGIDGELVEGNGDGQPFRIINDEQNDILRWDPASAFFHFQGGLLDEPISDLLDSDAPPADVARRFLELIGFDLYTIEYEQQLVENGDVIEVQFLPQEFPETGMDVSPGGSVFVDDQGAVLEAQLYWLSLVDIEIVAMRDPDAIIADVENDAGFAPPMPDDAQDEMRIVADDMTLVHVLTRLGESHFVLQPVVKIVGEYGEEPESSLPGPARYLVTAIEDDD
jgi:hypothetical protein